MSDADWMCEAELAMELRGAAAEAMRERDRLVEKLSTVTAQHDRDRAEIARLDAALAEARAEVERMRTEVAMLRRLWEAARDWKRAADTPGVEVWRFTERLDSVIDQVTDAMSPRRG